MPTSSNLALLSSEPVSSVRLSARNVRAVSGAAALDFFAANPVEGVVLDYCMPEMDGGQVASHMRKLKPEVPILLLSGYARDIPPEVLATVDIYITKGSGGPALLQDIWDTNPLLRQYLGSPDNPELVVYRVRPVRVRFMREWALEYHEVPPEAIG